MARTHESKKNPINYIHNLKFRDYRHSYTEFIIGSCSENQTQEGGINVF